MNKQEYIEIIKRRLAVLPQEEIDEAVLYVSEYFEDAGNDEKAVQALGNPNEFADRIKDEYIIGIRENPKEYQRYQNNYETIKANHAFMMMLMMVTSIFLSILAYTLLNEFAFFFVVVILFSSIVFSYSKNIMVLPLAIFSVLIICSSWVFISFNTTLSSSTSLADGLYLIGGMLISTGVFGLSIYGWKNEYKKIMKENQFLKNLYKKRDVL